MRMALRAILLLVVNAGVAHAAVPASQRDALLELYAATRGADWRSSAGWLGPAGTECQWFGVTCDAGETTVLEITLPDNRLLGTIPPSFADLVDLEVLGLGANQLAGELPSELGQLASLRELVLGSNELEGAVPGSFGSMTGLEILDLGDNHLVGPLPPELGQLAGLRRLLLQGNAIFGEIPNTWLGLSGLEDGQSDLRWNGLFTDNTALRDLIRDAHAPSHGAWYVEQVLAPWGLSTTDTNGISTVLHWQTPWGSYLLQDVHRVVWEIGAASSPTGPFEVIEQISTASLGMDAWRVFGLSPGETKYLAVRIRFGPGTINHNTLVTEYSAPIEVATTTEPSTWYAAPSGVPGNDCLSPATPCPTIQSAVDLAADGERVVVASGTYLENLVVDRGVDLVGAGLVSTVIDGNGEGSTIVVSSAVDYPEFVRLRNLTITGGGAAGGSGVRTSIGTSVEIDSCRVTGNTTESYGGGVAGGLGFLQLTDTIVDHNHATNGGGGIYSWTTISVQGGSVTANSAAEGGGLRFAGHAFLDGVVVQGNTATEGLGGGAFVYAQLTEISNSSIVDNTAVAGGGLYLDGHSNYVSPIFLLNSTISGNTGGGIQAWFNTSVSMDGCTVTENDLPWGYGITSWGDTRVRNTVIGGNWPADCDFAVESLGGNLESGETCGFDAWGDLPGTDPQLGALETSPSGLLVHRPLPGSPVIDAGNPVVFPATDQLGTPRPQDGDGDLEALPDIGAVEIPDTTLFSDGFESGDTTAWAASYP